MAATETGYDDSLRMLLSGAICRLIATANGLTTRIPSKQRAEQPRLPSQYRYFSYTNLEALGQIRER